MIMKNKIPPHPHPHPRPPSQTQMQTHLGTRKAARRPLHPRAAASVALDDEENLTEYVDANIDDNGSETGPSKRHGSRNNIYETDGGAGAVLPRCRHF
jgi:hypothetical protein